MPGNRSTHCMDAKAKTSPSVAPSGQQMPAPGTRWLAIYTKPRFEQRVANYCSERGCRIFLPTYQSWRQWSDRRKLLRLPLFPSYVFANVNAEEQRRVMQAPGFLWFVKSRQGLVEVDAEELHAVERLLESGLSFDPLPEVHVGDEVEITSGALKGCHARLLLKEPGAMALVVTAIQSGVRVRLPDPSWVRKL